MQTRLYMAKLTNPALAGRSRAPSLALPGLRLPPVPGIGGLGEHVTSAAFAADGRG
jgi:hypothetical protein